MLHLMLTSLTLLMTAVSVSAPSLAQGTPTPAGLSAQAVGPKAKLDSSEASWGSMIQGDRFEQEIKISNVGDAPLQIVKVLASCGCATATHDKVIAPGESGKVSVVIDSSSLIGNALLKFVTIETNDPKNNRIRYWLKGEVKALVRAEPPHLRLIGFPGEALSLEATLFAATELGAEILEIKPRDNKVTVALEPLEKGQRYRLKLTAPAYGEPRQVPEKLDVKIRTKDGKIRTLEWSAVAQHRRPWTVEPLRVTFHDTTPLREGKVEELLQTIKVKAIAPGFKFKIVSADVTLAAEGVFVTRIETITEGREYAIQVKLSKALDRGVHAKGKIEIVVDAPTANKHKIFVHAYF